MTLYMDATLTPNRSLSRRGFKLLLAGLILMNLAVGTLFVAMGALPVPIFLGLDVLGVVIAFRASYRSAGQSERVQVSADEVRVLHQIGGAARLVWTSPTAFTRVDLAGRDAPDARLRLRLSGRQVTLARTLSAKERIAFAGELERAIGQARGERYASQI